jgi:uncharacterized protein YfeS
MTSTASHPICQSICRKNIFAKCWLEKTRPFGLIELEDQFYSSGSAQNKNKDKNIFLHPGKKSFSKGQKVLKL